MSLFLTKVLTLSLNFFLLQNSRMSTESPRFILRKRIFPKSQVQLPKGSTSPKSSSSSSSSSNVDVEISSHESVLSVESSTNVSTTASSCETSVSSLSSSLQSLSLKKNLRYSELRISEQLNKFVLDANEPKEKLWFLLQSNKGGFKLVSCGYAYTVDRPRLHIIKSGQASTILWRFDTPGCKGRGKSNGLNPPFSITVAHDIHVPSLEKLTQVKMKNEVREKALNLNDAPRTIIASSQKHLSREEVWSLSRPDAHYGIESRTFR
jgi:hypothetical protein